MTDEEIQKVADKIIEHLRVQHLSLKPNDALIIQMEEGAMAPNEVNHLVSWLESIGLARGHFVLVRPGRGDLKFTVLSKADNNYAQA